MGFFDDAKAKAQDAADDVKDNTEELGAKIRGASGHGKNSIQEKSDDLREKFEETKDDLRDKLHQKQDDTQKK